MLLNLFERPETMRFAKKGENVGARCNLRRACFLASANYLRPTTGWPQEGIDALEERFTEV